jgi:hypothetical protein
MSGVTFIQLAQLCTILVGFLGVAVAWRSHVRQMHAKMFLEFSGRLHHVLGTLPAQTWMPADKVNAVPPRSDDLTRSCLQCFHIIADLHQLHRGRYISQDLWRPWQVGIRRTMQGPVLQREWLAMEDAFSHNPEFCRYMRGLIYDKSGDHRTGVRAWRAKAAAVGDSIKS